MERERFVVIRLGAHRADDECVDDVRGRGAEPAVHRLRDPGRDLRRIRQRLGDHRLR